MSTAYTDAVDNGRQGIMSKLFFMARHKIAGTYWISRCYYYVIGKLKDERRGVEDWISNEKVWSDSIFVIRFCCVTRKFANEEGKWQKYNQGMRRCLNLCSIRYCWHVCDTFYIYTLS